MKLSELSRALLAIADRGGGFGSETESALRTLAAALSQRADDEVSSLAKLLKAPKPRAPRAPTAPKVLSAEAVGYVEALRSCTSREAGEEVLTRMAKDKQIKKAESVAIAQAYTGSTRAFGTKTEAFDAIKDRLRRADWDQGALSDIRARAGR